MFEDGFTILSDSQDGRNKQFRVNIVFIHGLGGHPRKTWTEEKPEPKWSSGGKSNAAKLFRSTRISSPSKKAPLDGSNISSDLFWPEELLAKDIPQAKVWTYGYNADAIGGFFQPKNKNSISQHGQDFANHVEREIEKKTMSGPIIFVAHSLGGIVVKDAIHKSTRCSEQTKLVVFLGTPHRGSGRTGWGKTVANLACIALQDSHKKIIETLDEDNEVLNNIHEEFVSIVQKCGIKIHSFQEARAISGFKGADEKVVDPFSSRLDLPRSFETVESIDANHMQMAKCSGRNDPRYRKICGVLTQFITCNSLEDKTQEARPRQSHQELLSSTISEQSTAESSLPGSRQPLSGGVVFNGSITGKNVIPGQQITGGTANFNFN